MRNSAGFRFLVVGLLALFMFIPLWFVGQVIDSRANYSRQTITEVGREWGGHQQINGPRIVIPVEGPVTRLEQREVLDTSTGQMRVEQYETVEISRARSVYIYPEQFIADISTVNEVRQRGIFRVPVYSADAHFEFEFVIPELGSFLDDDEEVLWDLARLEIGLATNRALRGEARLQVGGEDLALEPQVGAEPGGGIQAALGDPRERGPMVLDLGFNGAEKLQIAPVGRTSHVTLSSDWPHPSFTGAFLPNSSEITDDGFTASWTIPHLARSLPLISRQDQYRFARDESFGVRYYQPNDFYQKAYRASRYGILFIALTFLTVLLIEDRAGRPAHPVQYILIGLAQSVFVLLMVAYAEQIGFAAAYLVSSAATIGVLVMFGITGLGMGRRAWVLGALLVAVYGVLYLILRSADFALLAGATLAFVALAGTMYATRNEDWYGPERPKKPKKLRQRDGKAESDDALPPAPKAAS